MDADLEQKLCADCGRENLETDSACRACGSPELVGARAAEAVSDDAEDRTLMWGAPPVLPGPKGRQPQTYAAAAAALGLAVGTLGYWLGRSGAEAEARHSPPAQRPEAAQRVPPAGPVSLPQPPPIMTAFGPPPAYAAAPAPPQDPTVVIRPRLRPAPQRPLNPPAPAVPAIDRAPAPAVRLTQKQEAWVIGRSPVVQPQDLQLPRAGASPVHPSESTAVVSLRNETPTAVRVSIAGDGSRTATIGAGSTFPFALVPGTYQLSAGGAGLSTPTSTLILGPARTYTLVVAKQREGGKDTLVLVEPDLTSSEQ